MCKRPNGTCCLKEHEDVIQEALEIYGDTYWDCRLTILRYSECGRCAPDAHQYASNSTTTVKHFMNFTMSYIGNTGMPLLFNQNYGVRLCRQACENLYMACSRAKTIPGEPIIPPDVTLEEYCADAPLNSTNDTPCYNNATSLHNGNRIATLMAILFSLATVIIAL